MKNLLNKTVREDIKKNREAKRAEKKQRRENEPEGKKKIRKIFTIGGIVVGAIATIAGVTYMVISHDGLQEQIDLINGEALKELEGVKEIVNDEEKVEVLKAAMDAVEACAEDAEVKVYEL